MATQGRPRKVREGIAGGKAYPCFTKAAMEQWRALVAPADTQPCVDCTPEYRDQMMADGRCLHPETLFVVGEDGFVTGVNRCDPSWAPMHARAVRGQAVPLVPRDAELFGQVDRGALENTRGHTVALGLTDKTV